MLKILTKIFPSKHDKDVKLLLPIVEEINKYFEEYKSLTDEQLRGKTQELKQRIKDSVSETEGKIAELREKLKEDLEHSERMGIYDEIDELDKEYFEILNGSLEEVLPEAFAVVKDTCRRLCGQE